MYERFIRRYSAYFFGWCQAFGEHEVFFEENKTINWLYGESKVGLVFSPKIRRLFLKEVLRKDGRLPSVLISDFGFKISGLEYFIDDERDRNSLKAVIDFFKCDDEIHMFLTSHFCYPPGTKIITFSKRKPLPILYKEIAPFLVKIVTY